MFNIIIKDAAGKIIAGFNADRYMVVAQNGQKFTKSFNSPDYVEQLGLLSFAKEQIKIEMAQIAGPEREVI